ncbi:MAG: energy transducer TonB, partial [Acidobacteria bacterium]|nr:energy transducer TonB [Acidobacteriota bacterium]
MRARHALLPALLAFAPPAAAQDSAANLDELLRMVQEGRASEEQKHREREQRFRAARDQQERLLAEARREVAAAERLSEEQEDTYDANELIVADVSEQLENRMGHLRELFGVLQQVSSDTQGLLESSVTNVQYPGRGEFLSALTQKIGTGSTLPSIEEIEHLWFLMQQEMTETGKVVKFPTTVLAADGRELQEDVVRVGGFNLVADGRYLQYTPDTGNLSELARQPQRRFTNTTRDLFQASANERVAFGVDPTRGQILATFLDRPSLRERIDQGQAVGYVIIALGLIGLLIAVERMVMLFRESRRVSAQLKDETPRADNSLGRVLQAAEENKDADIETLELKLGEAVFKETPKLTRALLFIKIISVVAPLLGLLGTVTGMIVTFQAITLFGTGDPKLMAGGISQALV